MKLEIPDGRVIKENYVGKNIENYDMNTLQSSYKIRKQVIGGYLNNGVRRIVYENGYGVRTIR